MGGVADSVADSVAEAFNRSSDPDQLKHEQPLLNPLLVGGVADSVADSVALGRSLGTSTPRI